MNINENDVLIVKDNSKRIRKSNAIKLPPQINESMIPKYVVYYKECYNREKMLFREFFKIEKHPKIKTNKIYTSSKSNKILLLSFTNLLLLKFSILFLLIIYFNYIFIINNYFYN
mgnify:CR=1 FL=1